MTIHSSSPTQPHPELQNLVDLFQIKSVAENRFCGQSEDIGAPGVFGGQILGQALMAASLTVPTDRLVHSFHAYFLLAGRHEPIDYTVERVRDGGSFSTRRVQAHQQGATIFDLSASFQQQGGFLDQHDPMQRVPGPEGIADEREYRRAINDRLPPSLRDKPLLPLGIEYRPLLPFDVLDARPREARASIWMRAAGPLPDSPVLHRALLAYASDHGPLLTSILPLGLSLFRGELQVASIDHAIWFHRDFRIDDWLLYQLESPTIQDSRTLCRGAIYTRDGRLVASTMQEGLVRVAQR